MTSTYDDFEVDISQDESGGYSLSVRSPMGLWSGPWQAPWDRSALEWRLKDLQIALLSSGGARRSAPLPQEQTVQAFGTELYDSLFAGEVRSLFESSLRAAEDRSRGLRLRLSLQAPDIAALPWEYLYYKRRNDFIALASDIPIVRQLPMSAASEPLSLRPPLRILGMIADPANMPPIDARAERTTIERAVAPLVEQGLVVLRWVQGRNWRDLQRTLRVEPWHIVHFVGHGAFDEVANEGVVYFCDDRGQAERLTATNLNRILAAGKSLRLVLLNACQGAATNQQDIFSSSAAALVRGGIPAVVAMQYAITDRAATEFARSFYEAVADGLPVDTAIGEARRAVSVAVTNTLEWGVPVLLMASRDGAIFSVESGALSQIGQAAAPPRPPQKRPAESGPTPGRQEQDPNHSNVLTPPLSQDAEPPAPAEQTPPPTPAAIEQAAKTLAEGPETQAMLNKLHRRAGADKMLSTIGTVIAAAIALLWLINTYFPDFFTRETTTPMPVAEEVSEPTPPQDSSGATGDDQPAGVPLDLSNMVYIPAGTFEMGCESGDGECQEFEGPPHEVYLDGFYIDRYEVTNDRYAKCYLAGACDSPAEGYSSTRGDYHTNPNFTDYPVINLTWYQARDFCEWEGKSLPTEAQWAKAAGSGQGLYPWGDEGPDCSRLNFDAADDDACFGDTSAVDELPDGATPLGVFNMAGNVSEWTADRFSNKPFGADPVSNPTGPDAGTMRVIRGGSFEQPAGFARNDNRLSANPDSWSYDLGFRCATAE